MFDTGRGCRRPGLTTEMRMFATAMRVYCMNLWSRKNLPLSCQEQWANSLQPLAPLGFILGWILGSLSQSPIIPRLPSLLTEHGKSIWAQPFQPRLRLLFQALCPMAHCGTSDFSDLSLQLSHPSLASSQLSFLGVRSTSQAEAFPTHPASLPITSHREQPSVKLLKS